MGQAEAGEAGFRRDLLHAGGAGLGRRGRGLPPGSGRRRADAGGGSAGHAADGGEVVLQLVVGDYNNTNQTLILAPTNSSHDYNKSITRIRK